MREFEYFLYENFDADKEAGNPHNPRNYFGSDTDAVLSSVAAYPEDAGSYFECCDKFGARFIGQLCDVGILRHYKERLVFDCPIFLREDAAVLNRVLKSKAAVLTNMLESGMTEIRSYCARIENGFSVERNLYHILCGMVFDGYFFDYLSEKGTLSVSRKHGTGLDYLTIIYEKCNELHILSDGLLCSYNRLVSEKSSLQSFGDAGGERFDFNPFLRLLAK